MYGMYSRVPVKILELRVYMGFDLQGFVLKVMGLVLDFRSNVQQRYRSCV